MLLLSAVLFAMAADLPSKKYLNLAAVKTLAAAAETEAQKRGVHVSICIVDENGDLLFFQRGEGVTLGLAQGKFHVRQDPGTGERLVHNPFHGGADPGSQTVSRNERLPTQQRLTLAGLKRRVRGGSP